MDGVLTQEEINELLNGGPTKKSGGYVMNNLLYTELRNLSNEIKVIEESGNSELIAEGREKLRVSIKKVLQLCHLGRKEGVAALEVPASDMRGNPEYENLKLMIWLTVDGIAPQIVEEIFIAKYFACGFRGYSGLQHLIFLTGILSLEAGENPRVTEEKLLAMVPEAVAEEYHRREMEEPRPWTLPKETYGDGVEKYYAGEVAVKFGDDIYFLVKIMDYIILKTGDRSMQRLLREIDEHDLARMMMVLSGQARKHIFQNLSKRLGAIVAEKMDLMGAVRMGDAADATYKIFSVLMRLIVAQEIVCDKEDMIKHFAEMIGFTEIEELKRREEKEGESDVGEFVNPSDKLLYPFGNK